MSKTQYEIRQNSDGKYWLFNNEMDSCLMISENVASLLDICNILNDQQATIERLQEEIKRLEKMISKIQWRFQQEVGIEKAREHYREIDKEMKG